MTDTVDVKSNPTPVKDIEAKLDNILSTLQQLILAFGNLVTLIQQIPQTISQAAVQIPGVSGFPIPGASIGNIQQNPLAILLPLLSSGLLGPQAAGTANILGPLLQTILQLTQTAHAVHTAGKSGA